MRKIAETLMLLGLLSVQGGCVETREASHPNGKDGIVAREDFAVNENFAPPTIMERSFWNVLGGRWQNKADIKPLPTKIPADSRWKIERSVEPMLRDAARWYSTKDLLVPDPKKPLEISAAKLSEAEFDPKVPFILGGGGSRPHFRCMDDYQVDTKEYKKWKKEHPNFLGFAAGDEYDSDHVGFLTQPDMDKNVKRLREMGCSETAIKRAVDVLRKAAKDRDQALAASHAGYQAARHYYFDDPDKMVFLHSAWCWDHYPLEWGAGMIILETTSTGAYRHQLGMAFTRGASRQYGKPWEWYIAQCYNGFTEDGKWDDNSFPYCLTTEEAPFVGDGHVRGPSCGMSVSLTRRDMFLAYLAGASLVQHETWPYAYWQFKNKDSRGEPELSPYGEAMKEWYAFTQYYPDRGVSYAPVALLIPHNQGYPQWGGCAWSYFPVERPDTMIDAFTYTLMPSAGNVKAGQEGCLANSPYGDIYDAVLPGPPNEPMPMSVLANYKVAILLGGFNIDKPLAERLRDYVDKGGTLVINIRQLGDNFPEDFIGASRTGAIRKTEGEIKDLPGRGAVTLKEPYDYEQVTLKGATPLWTDSQGGVLACVNQHGGGRVVLTTVDYMIPQRSLSKWTKMENVDQYIKDMQGIDLPLVKLLMRQIVKETLPVEVKGDVEYGLNKVPDGWWVYLINNKGVTKFTRTAEKLDAKQTANVTIDMRGLAVTKVQELRHGDELSWDRGKNSLSVAVGPGDIKVVKIEVKAKED